MGLGSLILAISASTLTVINAAPQPEQSLDVNILAPTTIGVYFCPEAFWKGECEYLQNGPGICSRKTKRCCTFQSDLYLVKLDTSLAAQVSSVGPDEDASGCTFYE